MMKSGRSLRMNAASTRVSSRTSIHLRLPIRRISRSLNRFKSYLWVSWSAKRKIPPSSRSFSASTTSKPMSAVVIAACMPPIPPPMTKIFLTTWVLGSEPSGIMSLRSW